MVVEGEQFKRWEYFSLSVSGTATGVAASQIGGENDALKDIQENKSDKPTVSGNYLIDIFNYFFSE